MKIIGICMMAAFLVLGCTRPTQKTTPDEMEKQSDKEIRTGSEGSGPGFLGDSIGEEEDAPQPESTGYHDDSSEDVQE